jgi:DNA-binding transcriptional regulator YiaG
MNELQRAARDLTKARARLADAMSSAADVAVAAHAEGMTEVDLAQYLGVNRMTIRKWLGK